LAPLSGIVEADETYIHPRTRRGHKTWHENVKDEIEMGLRPKPEKKAPYQDNPTVFGILERDGRVRTVKVPATTSSILKPIMGQMIDMQNARLITDGHPAYRDIKHLLPHDVIDHEVEYVRGDVHTQGIENYWSLLKRGIYGVSHHVGEGYLPQYLNEFEFRFNRRKVSDAERFAALMGQTQGRLLWYCQTPQQENPHA
ncbi:MAG: IS1595 family transposase, partial [Chloroflexi bacterium]|nr:IS1595 family transposase [Chloroflexota bacterium]